MLVILLTLSLVQNLLVIFNSFDLGHDKCNKVNGNHLAIFFLPYFLFLHPNAFLPPLENQGWQLGGS